MIILSNKICFGSSVQHLIRFLFYTDTQFVLVINIQICQLIQFNNID